MALMKVACSLTDALVRTAIAAGADILTIHGRTRHQSSAGYPVNLDAIRFAVESAKGDVPCIANGDVFSVKEAEVARKRCNVQGVMSARGLLANPVSESKQFTEASLTLRHAGIIRRSRQDSPRSCCSECHNASVPGTAA